MTVPRRCVFWVSFFFHFRGAQDNGRCARRVLGSSVVFKFALLLSSLTIAASAWPSEVQVTARVAMGATASANTGTLRDHDIDCSEADEGVWAAKEQTYEYDVSQFFDYSFIRQHYSDDPADAAKLARLKNEIVRSLIEDPGADADQLSEVVVSECESKLGDLTGGCLVGRGEYSNVVLDGLSSLDSVKLDQSEQQHFDNWVDHYADQMTRILASATVHPLRSARMAPAHRASRLRRQPAGAL